MSMDKITSDLRKATALLGVVMKDSTSEYDPRDVVRRLDTDTSIHVPDSLKIHGRGFKSHSHDGPPGTRYTYVHAHRAQSHDPEADSTQRKLGRPHQHSLER